MHGATDATPESLSLAARLFLKNSFVLGLMGKLFTIVRHTSDCAGKQIPATINGIAV